MVEDRLEWTVAEDEVSPLVRAAALRAWRRTAVPGSFAVLAVAVPVGLARGWDLFAAFVLAAAAVSAWSWFATRRAVRRLFAASYPVGSTVSAEATGEALVLRTGLGPAEIAWSRFGRPRLGPELLIAKDAVSRQWLMVPRRLLRDAWLDRLGAPAPPD